MKFSNEFLTAQAEIEEESNEKKWKNFFLRMVHTQQCNKIILKKLK